MSCREAFEQTEHCRDEAMRDGLYIDELTAINWLIFMACYFGAYETRKGMTA